MQNSSTSFLKLRQEKPACRPNWLGWKKLFIPPILVVTDLSSAKTKPPCGTRHCLAFFLATCKGGTMVEERERVKRQTFLGLEIGLECNK